VCDEVHNLAFLVCLISLVVVIEGLIAVRAEELVVQGDDCLAPEDHPRLFEKYYHHRL
jgi:hypothetical protein